MYLAGVAMDLLVGLLAAITFVYIAPSNAYLETLLGFSCVSIAYNLISSDGQGALRVIRQQITTKS
ncbi:hypothetical protein BJI67_16435 (plasmid) [Acidihalobacter aeolianus]|uniref:Uncharacterized protein n=2 Tax=Acidihalobacter aeolianus TaxID=2792603 RepID=A0A1D8KCY8_9GAMM|nr:hypothetical protein BJI67_16435 [Acidihalobacter aeolianus]